jgi:hypothetical protein
MGRTPPNLSDGCQARGDSIRDLAARVNALTHVPWRALLVLSSVAAVTGRVGAGG